MMTTTEREQSYIDNGYWTDDRIGYLVSSQAAKSPDRELFAFGDIRVSYSQFDEWVTTVASDFVRHGVKPGDRVLVQLPNCLEALVLQVAAFRIGAVDTPVVPIYREHEMRQILADSQPTVIAVAAELSNRHPVEEVDALLEELHQSPVLRYIVGGERSGWKLVPRPGEVDIVELPEPLSPELPAAQLYTSGTTSAPKGVLLSSRALFAHLRNFQFALKADETTVLMAGTPLSHLGGFVAGLIFPAFLGARSVILPGWNPALAIPLVESERVTVMMGATVFLNDLVQAYERGESVSHRLTNYACAGATIPPSLIVRAEKVGVNAMRFYGMTETAGVCTGASGADTTERRSEWDGKLLPGMEIEAVDENRQLLAAGEVGELRIRGPQLLNGYTDLDITAAQIDTDGWFYPGDVGRVDSEGWVQMSGRSKDIVNRGGEKFSTADIESAIASHPDVLDAAVTAVPDERFGEAVGAWVVLKDPTGWTGPDAILEHLRDQKLAVQKTPVEWHVVPSIAVSASGKVQKHRLVELQDLAVSRSS